MDALDVEMSIAEGAQAHQVLMQCARESAGTLAAHEAEKGIFKRVLPIGLAAMQLYFAQRGTGDMGPAVTRADGVLLPREQKLRGRASCSIFGKLKVARPCDRVPGEPGIFPLDAQVNLPKRCDAYFLQEWMTLFEGEHPFQESAGLFAQLFDLEVAESVLMAVAKEAPEDYDGFYAQRPVPPEEGAGALRVVSFDGKGVPMLKEEAVKLTAKLGTGEKRQKKPEALVGVSDTVDPKPRSPAALAELLVDPDAARRRRPREGIVEDAPRAQQVRRLASLMRTKPAVMEGIKADAERRAPQHRPPLVVLLAGALGLWPLATKLFKAWKHVTFVLDIMHVVGYLWSAANALFGEQATAGKHWVQQKLRELLRGRVGSVIGGLRQILTKHRLRKSVRETLANGLTCFHNHRRWMHSDVYLAAGVPVGTGVVESACGSVVKHRMEGEGTRWSLAGAEAMLTWRARKKSHDNDLRAYWKFRARQLRGRLDGHKPQYSPTLRLRRVASFDSKRLRSFPIMVGYGTCWRGWTLAMQGQDVAGLAQMHEGLAAAMAIGQLRSRPFCLLLLAEAAGQVGQVAEGLRLLTEALEAFEASGRSDGLAEAYRLQGVLLLRQALPDVAQAEGCFQKALALARRQQAKSWELRAATSLSRLWQQHDKREEARHLLPEIYGWFTEGFETADLREAKALLEELS